MVRNSRQLWAVALVGIWLWATVQPADARGREEGRRWEVGVDTGFEFGSATPGLRARQFSRPRDACVPLNTLLDCDPAAHWSKLGLDTLGLQAFGLPLGSEAMGNFLTRPSLHPREGGTVGLRLGRDVSSHWQLEFMFQQSAANLAFDRDRLKLALDAVEGQLALFNELAGAPAFRFVVVEDGRPRGENRLYQLNLNYHLKAAGQFIPYLGAGGGFMRHEGGPTLHTQVFVPGLASPALQDIVQTDADTNFALNFGGGMKMYLQKNLGFRAEVRNVIARYRSTHLFETLDVGLMCGLIGAPSFCNHLPEIPNSGTFKQRSYFNHLYLTGGAFVRF